MSFSGCQMSVIVIFSSFEDNCPWKHVLALCSSIFVQVSGRKENRVTLGCSENCFMSVQQGLQG